MMKGASIGVLLLAGLGLMGVWSQPGEADPIGRLPEFVIKDQNGTVLGPRSQASGTASVAVLMRDTINNETFDLQIAANSLRGADSNDVWYTNADCTGTAYVLEPAGASPIAEMRGSVYAVGRKAGATNEDSVIVRGAGTGANNDAAINSRFRTFAPGAPSCSASDPGVNTVQATQVMDLSTLVRPFVAE